jgi:hypothetical protein
MYGCRCRRGPVQVSKCADWVAPCCGGVSPSTHYSTAGQEQRWCCCLPWGLCAMG